jgi:hypothetical protein
MKNWKTTAIGILTAVFYLGYKFFTHTPIDGQDVIYAVGLTGFGLFSKDANVTGGTVPQSAEAINRTLSDKIINNQHK